MKRAYVACATVTLVLGALAGCKKSPGNSGGSGGTGGTTTAATMSTTTSSTSKSASTTGTTVTTGSMTTATTGTMTTTGTMSSTSSGMLTCTGTQPYTNIMPGMCDLLNQDCTGNMTCVVVQDASGKSTTACQGMSGVKTTGTQCSQDSECVKGDFCFDVCTPVCCPGSNQPCGSGSCNLQINITGTQDFFTVCSFAPACTLFQANACMTGFDCHPDGNSPGLATCIKPSPNPVPEGGKCMFVNDCGNMESCFGAMGMGQCRYLCQVGSTSAPGAGGCPAMETCQHDPTLGFDSGTTMVGVCQPMMAGG